MRFTHDCGTCKPLGTWGEFDLYHCPGSFGGSVIARYGSEGPQYASYPVDVFRSAYIAEPQHDTCSRAGMAAAVAHERAFPLFDVEHVARNH